MSEKLRKIIRDLTAERDALVAQLDELRGAEAEASAKLAMKKAKPKTMTTRRRKPLDD